MNVLQQRRRANTRKLIQDKGLTPGAFAKRIARSGSYVSQLLSDKAACHFGYDIARHIEKRFRLRAGSLDESGQKIDLKALHIVINKVETALNRRHLQLNAADKAELIGYLYELKTGNKPPTEKQFRKIIADYFS